MSTPAVADPVPEHPFRSARDALYVPPNTRNFGQAPKPGAQDAAYRNAPPVYQPELATTVFERSMKSSAVTLSMEELLSISPDVRNKYREACTPKRVVPPSATGMATIFENAEDSSATIGQGEELTCRGEPLEATGSVIPDPYDAYLKHVHSGDEPEQLTVAKDSHALRSIVALIDNKERVQAILDPGCQIVAMSEDVCLSLGLIYDPTIKLNMQSANGEVDQSLGLVRNVPFQVGDIVLYLQIHVIRAAAYDILLGRPFDVLTKSVVRNFFDENQTVTIRTTASQSTAFPIEGSGFSLTEDMSTESSGMALIIDVSSTNTPIISAYSPVVSSDPVSVQSSYLRASGQVLDAVSSLYTVTSDFRPTSRTSTSRLLQTILGQGCDHESSSKAGYAATKKKYKPVALKTRPVIASVPEQFRIVRRIVGDPLRHLPELPERPGPFFPTGRYTKERMEALDVAHQPGFLWPEERALMHAFMCLHNQAFAWSDSERGRFKSEYFPPIDFPVVPHQPWVQRNIPIPPGIYKEVCAIIKKKLDAGVYEPSNSSYRSRWFCVVKKDGKSLRLVHSLEPLNA
ncbi:uncharacterized protein LAESUDRAFT_765550, partial [Laetiporus sulphureus 93-53]